MAVDTIVDVRCIEAEPLAERVRKALSEPSPDCDFVVVDACPIDGQTLTEIDRLYARCQPMSAVTVLENLGLDSFCGRGGAAS